jgi:hypothetical protein
MGDGIEETKRLSWYTHYLGCFLRNFVEAFVLDYLLALVI